VKITVERSANKPPKKRTIKGYGSAAIFDEILQRITPDLLPMHGGTNNTTKTVISIFMLFI
jgi:predicted transcriptional regulator